MGCTTETALTNVTFTCADKPKGGLDEIIVARASAIDWTAATDLLGEVDLSVALSITGATARIDFNKKDGFSYAGTTYSGEPDGTDSYAPTVIVQLPRVDLAKLQSVESMLGGFNELIVFVKARTGEEFAFGVDNGMFGSALTTTTGTNTDKNVMELTFTGDEDSMERVLATGSWDALVAALVV